MVSVTAYKKEKWEQIVCVHKLTTNNQNFIIRSKLNIVANN